MNNLFPQAPQKKIYLLDTNVLIELSIWLPISLNNKFWLIMEDSLKKGDWVLIDTVIDEVRYGFDKGALKRWCQKQNNSGLAKKITAEDRQRATEINDQYNMIGQDGNSKNDPYIIAYVERNGLVLFSRENYRKNPLDPYKIRDVCDFLNIPYERYPAPFLEYIGYKN